MNQGQHSSPGESLEDALLAMDRGAASRIIEAAASAPGAGSASLADEIIVPALTSIGDQWESGAVALSQVYMAARILEEVLGDRLEPIPVPPGTLRIGIGVLEDYHALGKRIIHAVLASAGRDVVDLGPPSA